MSQPLLYKMIDKAVFDYKLIEKGDRILIGASGGKDSTALVEYFANRKNHRHEDFEFTALHVSTEITPPLNPGLMEFFKKWNVEPVDHFVDVLGRIKEGHKMNCWWCSTQRRTELLHFALDNGYNKICLGHHLDDFLETLLMNAVEHGELATMTPSLAYEKYPITVIRPLCYVPVNVIIQHSQEMGYVNATCTCTYQDNSGRKDARKKLDFLCDGDDVKKIRLFNSLKKIKTDYLP